MQEPESTFSQKQKDRHIINYYFERPSTGFHVIQLQMRWRSPMAQLGFHGCFWAKVVEVGNET